MDPLSVTAAIAGFIGLAAQAATFFQDWRHGPKERLIFSATFRELEVTLQSIKDRADEVENVKRAISKGRFGQPQDSGKIYQRYDKAMAPGGHFVTLNDKLTGFLGAERSLEASKLARFLNRLTWTMQKDDLKFKLDHVLTSARLLRDYLYDDEAQIAQATYVGVVEVGRRQAEAEVLEILDWLCPAQETLQMRTSDIYSFTRNPDPFIQSEIYKQWVSDADTSHWQLSCFGKPGSGKSYRARTVISDLLAKFPSQNTPILSIMFHHKNETRQSLQAVFCSLLRQLISQTIPIEIPPTIRELWNQRRLSGHNTLAEQEARDHLVEELRRRPLKFVVVDALDEAAGCLNSIKAGLRSLRTETGLCIFSTDRLDPRKLQASIFCDGCGVDTDHLYWQCVHCSGVLGGNYALCKKCYVGKQKSCPEGTHKMQIPAKLNVQASAASQQIETFVRRLLEQELALDEAGDEDPTLYSGDTPSLVYVKNDLGDKWNSIPQLVSQAAGDSFLVAGLIVARLKRQPTAYAARKLLEEGVTAKVYDKSGNQYDYMLKVQYDDMLSLCLKKTDKDAAKVAYDHLAAVACAQEVLSFEQLSHAVSVEQGDKNKDNFEVRCCRKEIVRKNTDGLISIGEFGDPRMLAVFFFHRTLSTYLEQHSKEWFPDAHQKMFDACIAYLQLEIFMKPYTSWKDLDQCLLDYPFASYAACCWGFHLGQTSSREDNFLPLLELFESPDRKACIMQIAWYARPHAAVAWDVMNGVSLLHMCAFNGITDLCALLIQNGMDPDTAEETYGQTALHYACRRGNIEVIRLLLEVGANANISSVKGRTALIEAIEHDQRQVVDVMLEYPSVDVNARGGLPDETTPLVYASEHGKTNFVAILVKDPNILINQGDHRDRTALFWAVRSLSVECVQLILDHPELDITLKDKNGETALDYMAHVDYHYEPDADFAEHITKLLIAHRHCPPLGDDALQYLIEDQKTSLLEILLPLHSYVNWRDVHGRTLLHIAASTGEGQMIQTVYTVLSTASGFNVDATDKFGSTALHVACRSISVDRGAGAVYLLRHGADATRQDAKGLSPLDIVYENADDDLINDISDIFRSHLPVGFGGTQGRHRAQCIESLVHHGDICALQLAIDRADAPLQLDADPYTGATALQMAESWRGPTRPDLLKILLPKSTPYLDAVNLGGRTCMHSAAERGCTESLRLLIDAGAETDIKDNWGETPFIHAQRDKYHLGYGAAFLLINSGAKLPGPEKIHKDLLHCAIDQVEVTVVKRLIEAGVDLYHRKDGVGPTALELAKDRRRININASRNDMMNSRQWRDFAGAESFDNAALQTPKVKALDEIIDHLQETQKHAVEPSVLRRRVDDLSPLIRKLRSARHKTRDIAHDSTTLTVVEKHTQAIPPNGSIDFAVQIPPQTRGDTIVTIDLGNQGGVAIAVAIALVSMMWLWLRYQESLMAR